MCEGAPARVRRGIGGVRYIRYIRYICYLRYTRYIRYIRYTASDSAWSTRAGGLLLDCCWAALKTCRVPCQAGRVYTDYYKLVTENESRTDWRPLLVRPPTALSDRLPAATWLRLYGASRGRPPARRYTASPPSRSAVLAF